MIPVEADEADVIEGVDGPEIKLHAYDAMVPSLSLPEPESVAVVVGSVID